MKVLIIVVAIIAILGGLGYGAVWLNNSAYASGEAAGYTTGYSEGHETGYDSGEAAGYDQGYTEGHQVGEEVGYRSGEEAGRATGFSLGKTEGYNEGFDEGYTDGSVAGYDQGYTEGNTDGYELGMEASLGHGYTILDPTYQQVLAFLASDTTSNNEYNEPDYVCSHFARDVVNNAEDQGIRGAFVELRYADGGHSIVAFNTIDRGLVYFEPQTDEAANPVIGAEYHTTVVPRPGYYYETPPFDDTILDLLVIW